MGYRFRQQESCGSIQNMSFIANIYEGISKCFNGTSAKDGNIYACAHHAGRALQINPIEHSSNLVGDDLGD